MFDAFVLCYHGENDVNFSNNYPLPSQHGTFDIAYVLCSISFLKYTFCIFTGIKDLRMIWLQLALKSALRKMTEFCHRLCPQNGPYAHCPIHFVNCEIY